jgi:hypothetical protein
VRQSTSVPAKFHIASRQATTATRIQALVVQKESFVTARGLRKPLLDLRCFGFCESMMMVSLLRCGDNYEVGAHWAEFGHGREAQRQVPLVIADPHSYLQPIGLGIDCGESQKERR